MVSYVGHARPGYPARWLAMWGHCQAWLSCQMVGYVGHARPGYPARWLAIWLLDTRIAGLVGGGFSAVPKTGVSILQGQRLLDTKTAGLVGGGFSAVPKTGVSILRGQRLLDTRTAGLVGGGFMQYQRQELISFGVKGC